MGSFVGTELPPAWRAELAAGRRVGAILFRANFAASGEDGPIDPWQVAALNRAIGAAAPIQLPPLVGVDQEGGRVRRLGPPFARLEPMRVLGRIDDLDLTAACAEQLG